MLAPMLAGLVLLGPAPPPVSVRWSAPAPCPDQEHVRGRIGVLLAQGGSGRRDTVTLQLVVTTIDGGFELTATSRDAAGESGERVLRGTSCDDLAEAAALVAAIAIDPELTLPPSATGDDPPPPPSSASPPDPPGLLAPEPVPEPDPSIARAEADPRPGPAPRPEPGPRPEPEALGLRPPPRTSTAAPGPDRDPAPSTPGRQWTPLVAAGFGVGLGRLANAVPMVLGRFGAGAERGHLRLLARLSGAGPSFGRAPGGPGGGLFGLGALGVMTCARTLGRPVQLVGCAGTDVGVVGGRGRRTVTTRTASSVWWALEAELGLEYALRPTLALALRIDGGGVPATPDMVIDGQGRVCCVRWGAGARVGVVGRFRARGERRP